MNPVRNQDLVVFDTELRQMVSLEMLVRFNTPLTWGINVILVLKIFPSKTVLLSHLVKADY
jgi:hypothetical protein